MDVFSSSFAILVPYYR